MKAVLGGFLMVVGLALGGCGNNECEDAADKFKECGVTDSTGSGSGDCSGASECFAKCVNSSSCEDLKSTSLDSKFLKCVTACGG